MSRTLLRNGRVVGSAATAVAFEDDRLVLVGDEAQAEAYAGADEVVDLRGALVTPGFVDAHVHTVRTGFALTGLDLAGTASLAATLDRVAGFAAARPDDGVLVGQGWDETGWPEGRPPTGDELERAAPTRRTYLTRVDGHSSIVSPALAALVPGLEGLDGWTADGRVERDAHHAVRAVLEGLIGPDERLEAARSACRAMAAQGITSFHENAAPHIGPEHEIDLVRRAAAETGLRATVYWGELMAIDTARRLGVAGLAGDLVADGAFGSRTAALSAPYADRPDTCGHAYVSAEQVADHVVACTEAGLQAGFHCIGDAALDAIGAGLEEAERRVGTERLAAAGHRLEHVEMPSPHVVGVLARLGVVASVQPMFDALWGGPHGMYAARLGDRWRGSNPFRALDAAGVTLAFGSDSPVTPLGPWAAIRAASEHHDPDQRIPADVAFRAHTRGGALAGRDHDGGMLVAGHRADVAVWDTATDDLPRLLRTVAAGRTIHTHEDAA
jgi:predicted amidohydrolase YtcJ